MNRINIPFLEGVSRHTPVEELLANLAPLPATGLVEVPWKAFPYCPSVHFKIAHTAVGILLLFEVQEKHVKAVYHQTNDPVYKDSCVEFFLSFDGSNYYNLEFNCIGTGLIGYGPAEKARRKRLPPEIIELVQTYSSIAAEASDNGDTAWRLLLHVPLAVFYAHTMGSMASKHCTGNFYKCGDDLPEPHYVAWNPIDHPTPNFHLPQHFGELAFD